MNKERIEEIERRFYDYAVKGRGGPQFTMDDFRTIRELTDFAFKALTSKPTEVERTSYQAPSGFKLMPKEPTDAMMRALEGYYAKWQRIIGKDDDTALKADCWSAYHAYLAMYEAAPITETIVSPLARRPEEKT